ncbi:MAG: GMC family oxidoreductase [Bryobacteraceae bacterium]
MAATFDVCVVGSGPGGGIAAYVLAEAGLKVALIEAGRRVRPGVDYNGHAPIYENLPKRAAAGLRPVSSVWNDFQERDHFVGVGDRPGHGLLRVLGGRSVCWAGHSLRFGPLDFKRWPIPYEEVAPYYSKAERLMCVHGFKDGLSNMPDGDFQPGVPLRCSDQMVKRGVERLKKQGREMEFVAQRKAIPTVASHRATCHYCGHCMKGCEIDSKYTSANTPIPMALKTGNLTLLTECMMTRIVTDSAKSRIKGVEYVGKDGKTAALDCRALVLSCSTVETARLLLIHGLANSSGQVGKNLMSHFGVTVFGLFPNLRGRDASRDEGTDYFHGLLTNLYWNKPSKDFEGTYQVQVASGLQRFLPLRDVPGFGEALKRDLREKNVIHTNMNMQAMMLPSPGTFVDLAPDRKDRFGLPLPRVHLHYGANELAMARDMVRTCEEIVHAAGGEIHSKPTEISPRTLVIDLNHWAGTIKMGRDPKTSVVNTSGQSHDIPNLFVADASVFPAYPEKNPTLTNVTLSWRTAALLAEKMKRREV